MDGADGTLKHLVRLIAELQGVDEMEIDPDEGFGDYGFDSVSLTTLARRLGRAFDVVMPVEVFFEHTTIRASAEFIHGEYKDRSRTAPPRPTPHAVPDESDAAGGRAPDTAPAMASPPILDAPSRTPEPIAIIGMSGQMPRSEDLFDFWDHLIAGRSLISEITPDRLDRISRRGAPDRETVRAHMQWGGYLDRIDRFDNFFFSISPREAGVMDPQQRLFLETAWHTIENAGYDPADLSGSNAGVFVGVANHDYAALMEKMNATPTAHASTGVLVHSILANRVSYHLDLKGPSEIIDTACSSSNVAIHRAIRAIRAGECETAIAGGVNVLLDPRTYIALGEAGVVSRTGEVVMFNENGSGYVRGEGVGAVLLKPFQKAIEDRDHIYALIKGSAINHDGRNYSLTAPNPAAQADVIYRAREESNVSPAAIDYIEAQGTGSAIGDRVEISAFKKAFKKLHQTWGSSWSDAPRVGVGYLKPVTGHLESASGIAALIKTLLAF
ncbi:MAG: hypothetical protein GY859_09580 [Desulfobacterales bacterium]|nr:hypothetical protein [Desulfobacterales bacterium]